MTDAELNAELAEIQSTFPVCQSCGDQTWCGTHECRQIDITTRLAGDIGKPPTTTTKVTLCLRCGVLHDVPKAGVKLRVR